MLSGTSTRGKLRVRCCLGVKTYLRSAIEWGAERLDRVAKNSVIKNGV